MSRPRTWPAGDEVAFHRTAYGSHVSDNRSSGLLHVPFTFTGTNRKLKRLIWFIIITQWLVNLATMIEILVSCEQYQMLWNTNMKQNCVSPMVQTYIGYFQGGMSNALCLFIWWLKSV